MHDVAIVGGGLAGMATAARLQARGMSTIVFESHGHIGGCAGFFRKRGFAFDVGATTLVDYTTDGVGGQLFSDIGMTPPPMDTLPGYVAWLPGTSVFLHRDAHAWRAARRALGDSAAHRRFWSVLDRLADAFWPAARAGARLPMSSLIDAARNLRTLAIRDLSLLRYLRWTIGDLLRACDIRNDRRVAGLLSMIVEDTVHSTLDRAPLINAALGVTMRGAGLCRAIGGMYGFWRRFAAHYRTLGGIIRLADRVERIDGWLGGYTVHARSGVYASRQVVCAMPAETVAAIAPAAVQTALRPYIDRDRDNMGGAFTMYLGVHERDVENQRFTHHQILEDFQAPLGNGNNMFISVSAPGDLESAPLGHRAVMLSTHCGLDEWHGLDDAAYQARKRQVAERLLGIARRVYPRLARLPVQRHEGTPRTFERFTLRQRGAVGGARLHCRNANQYAIPHQIGQAGFHLAGDTTWPGLGTVACTLSSAITAENVLSNVRLQRIGRIRLRRAPAAVPPHAA